MNIEEFRKDRGWTVTELCRRAEISRATFYAYKDRGAEVTCSEGEFAVNEKVERARGRL